MNENTNTNHNAKESHDEPAHLNNIVSQSPIIQVDAGFLLCSLTEAANQISINPSTLRKYEKDYNLKISRNALGRRVYREDDLDVLQAIKILKDKGANIHEIRHALLQHPGWVEDVQAEAERHPNTPKNERVQPTSAIIDIEQRLDRLTVIAENLSLQMAEVKEQGERLAAQVGIFQTTVVTLREELMKRSEDAQETVLETIMEGFINLQQFFIRQNMRKGENNDVR